MERITYRKTLDVHKSGVQFLLQGFETADRISRVIEMSLMASGDAIDFPLERIVAMMYVTSPGDKEPSINECFIKDNKVVYEVLPIVTEGITEMQIKLIETSPEGAKSVLAAPKFSVEVTKSGADDESAEKTTTFTALEEAMAKAKTVYDERFLRMELTNDCMFRAYYADGSLYETDVLKRLFHTGSSILSESFAHGGTGTRIDEDTDNAMYYSNVAKSEALNAKDIMQNSQEILEEVQLHGVYTAFNVDFETGEVEYVSPSFKFNINLETGELETEGQAYTFEDEVGRVVTEWLGEKGIVFDELKAISTVHTQEISELKETTANHTNEINSLEGHKDAIYTKLDNVDGEVEKLYAEIEDAKVYRVPWNVDENVGSIYSGYQDASDFLSIHATNSENPGEKSFSFPMINSGSIKLIFRTNIGESASRTRNPRVVIYKNDEIAYEASTYDELKSITHYVSLNVNHKDIITVYGYIESTSPSSGNSMYIRNFDILANIDTPYKYAQLVESEITLSDIVNALIGE